MYCNCHGSGCNSDWASAGGSQGKCYTCSSAGEGDCSDAQPGTLEQVSPTALILN